MVVKINIRTDKKIEYEQLLSLYLYHYPLIISQGYFLHKPEKIVYLGHMLLATNYRYINWNPVLGIDFWGIIHEPLRDFDFDGFIHADYESNLW